MKRFLAILLLILFIESVYSADIKLAWDQNPQAEQITLYNIYSSPSQSGPWTKVASSNTNSTTIQNIQPGILFYRVTAVNLWGESGPSNIVSSPPAAGTPTNLTITITVTVSVP